MITIMNQQYYTSREISKLSGKGIQTVLQYARTHDNILKIGDTASKNLQYYWTEENLKEYIEYAKTVKRGKKVGSVTNTTNLDTLYHRAERYLKSNNIEGYNQTRKLIEEIRQQKKLNK